MQEITMRQTKDGDYSPCAASEENVGKRKCNHVPTTTAFKVKVQKLGARVKEVTISDDYMSLDKRDKREVVKKFLDTLEPADEEDIEKAIAELRHAL